MPRVLVVCTVHNPQRASTGELHWLLTRLRPEVLFLEHPPAAISSFRDCSCGTLESFAVAAYLRTQKAELVPVDVDTHSLELPASKLEAHADELFARLAETSPRYRALDFAHSSDVDEGGCLYLNSALGWRRESELHSQMRDIVEAAGDRSLTDLYELWVRTHDSREYAFLAGVEAYAQSRSFSTGVLLVGAAHRAPLIEKSVALHQTGSLVTTWDFEWELEDPGINLAAQH